MRGLVVAAIGFVLALTTGRADAYPQFQMSRDTTCNACHIAPQGGGLLNENGLLTAETLSQWGQDPAFMYGTIKTPEWLQLGGDFRGLAGYFQTPRRYLLGLPMQADLYANARFLGNFSAQLTVGMRPRQDGNEAATAVWAREHYLQWQSKPDERESEYIRLGHLMPVFGLRFIEHPIYTRRYGGTPLMSETYGLSFSTVRERFEAHVTGFIENPLLDGVAPNNGVAAYGEYRVDDKTQVGLGGMFTKNDFEQRRRVTVTAKRYLDTPGLLLQAELQWAYFRANGEGSDALLGANQTIGYLMGSYAISDAILVDLGVGHYDPDWRVQSVDRDCIELNVHWFATSHIELMFVSRVETIGWTYGAPTTGWAAGQFHYRL